MSARHPLSAWRSDLECPSGEPNVVNTWNLAQRAADQHPLSCRVLSIDGRVMAVGGLIEVCPADGLAFCWVSRDLPRMAWRSILPYMAASVWTWHERGVRRVSSVVSADFARGVRLMKWLGFSFVGVDTGFGGTVEPMLRYVHCWPAFDEPALVRHQCRELERACLGAWCPELVETEP